MEVKAADAQVSIGTKLLTPTETTIVNYNCIGNVCGWVHPCDANFCSGHDVPVELVGNGNAIWWGWSNSGDNCVLDFTIHY